MIRSLISGFNFISKAVHSYLGAVNSITDATTYSLPINFGSAAVDRWIIVCIKVGSTSLATLETTTVTIGGVTATRAINATGNYADVSIWFAKVPTGTSGNVDITVNSTALRCHVSTYSIYRDNLSVYDTDIYDTANVTTGSNQVAVTADSVCISGVSTTGSTGTFTWSNTLEDNDYRLEGTRVESTASIYNNTSETLVISATKSVSTARYTLATAVLA